MERLKGFVNGILICDKELNKINRDLRVYSDNDFISTKNLIERIAEVNKTRNDIINELIMTILQYPPNEYKIVKNG